MLMAEIGAPVVVDGIHHVFFSPDAYKWISIAGRAGLAGLEEALLKALGKKIILTQLSVPKPPAWVKG